MTIQKEPHICISCSAGRYVRHDQFIMSMNIANTAVKDNNDDLLPFSCLVAVMPIVVTYRYKAG